MYRIHIKAQQRELGSDPTYTVAVMQPGSSSAPVAEIKEPNLEAILYEVLATTSREVVQRHLYNAGAPDGDLIELSTLSTQHFNMLRGLPPKAVGR